MSFHKAATFHQTAFLLTHIISVPSIAHCLCSILPRSHHLKFFSSFHSDLSITPLPLSTSSPSAASTCAQSIFADRDLSCLSLWQTSDQLFGTMPKFEYPNRIYKPDYNDEIYLRPNEEGKCDENCECRLVHASGGFKESGITLSELVALSSRRAELRELQPREFWKAVAAYDVNADDLVYCVSNTKLYVGAHEKKTQLALSRAMELMGDNEEHQPLMDYIVIPKDTLLSGMSVMNMENDATVVVNNILATGYSKVLQLNGFGHGSLDISRREFQFG